MKRLLKILGAVIAALIVIIIVLAIVLPLVVDPNDYKGEITSMIEGKIGRQVSIPGDIELSVIPWLGVDIGRVKVANATGFGDQPLAEIGSANVHVKLLPLLHKQIQVGKVELDGLRLNLARNTKGQSNWAGIVEHLQSSEQAEQTPAQPSQSGPSGQTRGGFDLSGMEIDSVAVSDAAITWNDAMTGSSYKLSDFHLSTGHLANNQPFKLQMGATLAAATRGITSDMSLQARIHPNMSKGVYKFSDLALQLDASGKSVPGDQQKLNLTGQGVYDMQAGTFALDDLVLQAAGLDVSAQVDGKNLDQTPAFSGTLSVAQFDPRKVLDNLGVELPELQSDKSLRSASLDAAFSGTSNAVQLKQLQVNVDDTALTGQAKVTDFSAPKIAFNADVDALDVDAYLPVAAQNPATESGKQKKEQKQAQEEGGGETRIDLSALKSLDLDGKLQVGKLKAYNMVFNDATLAVLAKDGVLTLKPLASGFYDGKINMTATVDASKKVPTYTLRADLAQLKFAPLLKDVLGTDRVSALGSMQLDLASSGDTLKAIKQALDGTLQYELKDGAFYGFNLAELIANARNRLQGDGSDKAGTGAQQKTPFDRFAGQFSVNKGTVSGKSLTLDTPYLDVSGDGKYNLVGNDLDYTLNVQVDDKKGPLEDVAGLAVPVHLGGSLLSPDYSIDIASALKGIARQRLQEEKGKLKDKLQQKLKQRLSGEHNGDGDYGDEGDDDKAGDKDDDELNKKLQEGLSKLLGG